jgi:hypothetical protein
VPELDCIILGGYHRDGALWKGYPSRFLVGIAAPDDGPHDSDDDDHDVHTPTATNGARTTTQAPGSTGLSQARSPPSSQTQTQPGPTQGRGVVGYKGRKYYTFAKVAGGLDTTQRLALQARLRDLWITDLGHDKRNLKKLPFLKE